MLLSFGSKTAIGTRHLLFSNSSMTLGETDLLQQYKHTKLLQPSLLCEIKILEIVLITKETICPSCNTQSLTLAVGNNGFLYNTKGLDVQYGRR